MKAETEALLQECRTALLQQSNERMAALLTQWFECMIGTAPYLAHAQARDYQASLTWISRRQAALEGIVAEEAEAAAREVVALWAGLLAEERQCEAEQEALRLAALEPMWKGELKR
jgi:hypothetical protein